MTDQELIKEYVKTRIELQKYLNVLINRINNTLNAATRIELQKYFNVLINRINNTLNAAETIIENKSKKQP